MARQCKILNVAEKNDAARELSKVMAGGRVQRREGFSKFNKIYEFDFRILGKDCHMIMTSVSGHLLTLDFVLAYKNWNNCAPVSLFSADIRRYCPDNFAPIKRTLEREIRGCQHLILWTDGDREGENIADEIVEVITQVKSRGLQIHRARFSEITRQSIMRACNNLGQLDQRVSNAVKTRQEVDLRIGCAFTRFQTRRLSKAFPSVLTEQLISYGPCQFPTLGFVVDRYKQVEAFIPETFHKIKVTHETEEEKVDFTWKRVRVFNHTVCLVLYQMCLENPTACVVSTSSRPKSKWRPLPLDTVELEKQASRKLRINAKETMRIAEKLYTQGYISYPRTETNIFPPSFDLAAIVRDQTPDPQWGGFANQILTRGPTPRQGNKTDNAHPPIHPTKYTSTLMDSEQRIYEYVVRHFLACCSQDAKGQETTVEIDIAGENFVAHGLVITERNYLDVFPYDRWTAKVIPHYQNGSTFQPSSIEMCEGETTPPPLLHEADLIALMEKHGIGTDATHAEHIETIKARNYVGVQSDGSFVPGELGMGLVEGYDSMGYELSKPQLRAELEADLKRICEGTKSKEDVLSVTLDKYKEVFLNATQQAQKLDEALSKYFGPPEQITEEDNPAPVLSEMVRKCPLCQHCNLVIKRKRDGGFMLSCIGFPECRAVQYFPGFVTDAVPHESVCSKCQPQPVHKLKLQFRPGSVPPYVSSEHIGCTTCDHTLREELGFMPIRSSGGGGSTTANSSIAGGVSQSPRGRGRGARDLGGDQTNLSSPRGRGRGARDSGHDRTNLSSSWGRGRGARNLGGCRTNLSNSRGRGRGARDSGGCRTNLSNSRGRGRGARGFSGSEAAASYSSSRGDTGGSWNWNDGGFGGGGAGSRSHLSNGGASSDPDNVPMCNCGEVALLLTVRREDSVNKGRQFYKCSQRDGGCDFFLWADQAHPPPATGSSTTATCSFTMPTTGGHYNPIPTISSSNSSYSSQNRQPSLLPVHRTTRTGVRGRGSYRGSRNDNEGDDSSGGGGMRFGNFGGGGSHSDSNSGNGQSVMCNCGLEAVQRTVQKAGPNKGRQFFTCSKPRDDQCGFFEWADDVPSCYVKQQSTTGRGSGSGDRGRGRGRGRGGVSSASLSSASIGSEGTARKTRAPPTCSMCRQQGHTKRSCPQAKQLS